MVMLIAVLTLVMFFEHTDAGTPAVYPDADATAYHSESIVTCGIEGKLKNKESYSGSAYVYVRMTTEEDGWVSKSKTGDLWAKVYKTGWWWWSELHVDSSPEVSIIMFGNNASSAYAYARGTLGSITKRDRSHYPDDE